MPEQPYPFSQFIKDLAHYVKPYKKKFWWAVFFRFTSDLAMLYPAWAISQIVLILTKGSNQADLPYLLSIFVIWGILNLYFGFAHPYAYFLGFQAAASASLDLFKDCLKHVFRLDLFWQEIENSGNKMKRIDHGHDGVNQTIRQVFDVLIEVIVNTVGIVIIFFTLSPMLSYALIFFITSYYALGTYLLRKPVRQERIVNAKFEDLGGLTFESLNNIHTIKSLAIDKGIIRAVSEQISVLVKEIRKRIVLFQFRHGILDTYIAMFEFITVCFIAWGIWQGRYDISLLVLFIGLFRRVAQSAYRLSDITQELVVSKVWVSRAMHILKTTPEIEHPETIAKQLLYPENWKTLKIENVHFKYKKGAALRNISLTISRGENVGIVGLSGAGKSTLFKLLLDLYENYEGEIYLDDVPFKNMQRQSYVDHVGVVLQDTELFNMSLKDNIAIAKSAATEGQNLEEVIRMAHLDDVVGGLTNGLDTLVGEKGVKLSGGQRQRVGIARALYRQPDILLLDEATSHLDAHSEKLIQQALHETMHNFTTIVIAHRLSTIKAMDKIVVLGKGQVIESGTFSELINKNGAFAKMWQEQKL